ncbi:UNVERIFIED_CONTAM: hypothetical protein K2H54_051943 [Gekko kuhli]
MFCGMHPSFLSRIGHSDCFVLQQLSTTSLLPVTNKKCNLPLIRAALKASHCHTQRHEELRIRAMRQDRITSKFL